MEFLTIYSYKWRLIGTALNFPPYALDSIEDKHASKIDSGKHALINLIGDWVLKKSVYAMPPTVSNLKRALASQLVGLGALANQLKAKLALKKNPTAVDNKLPYLLMKVSIKITDKGAVEISMNYNKLQQVSANEGTTVLLEVQATVNK